MNSHKLLEECDICSNLVGYSILSEVSCITLCTQWVDSGPLIARCTATCLASFSHFVFLLCRLALSFELPSRTLYKLVSLLRKASEQVQLAVRLIAAGNGGRNNRPAYRQLDKKIKDLWDQNLAGDIMTAVLLMGCS